MAGGPALTRELSPRQRDVVRGIAEGKLMKQVAVDLGITARTVAFHKYRAMRALGIRSSARLVVYAIRSGMV